MPLSPPRPRHLLIPAISPSPIPSRPRRPFITDANLQAQACPPHSAPQGPPRRCSNRREQRRVLHPSNRRNIRLLRVRPFSPMLPSPARVSQPHSSSSSRAYAARMSFYKLKQFQCEVTGKSGLNYFQALESEQQESRTLHSRFPEQLKAAVLRSVQWRKMSFHPRLHPSLASSLPSQRSWADSTISSS